MGKVIGGASGHDRKAGAMKVIVGAAIVIFLLLVIGVFRRKGWKQKRQTGPKHG